MVALKTTVKDRSRNAHSDTQPVAPSVDEVCKPSNGHREGAAGRVQGKTKFQNRLQPKYNP